MKKAIPTLSTDGYVTDPKKILSYLFAHVHEVRHDDTNIYLGYATSVAKVIAEHGKSPDDFAVNLRTALSTCFNRFFDDVNLTVTAKTTIETSEYSVDIDMVVTLDGKSYSLGRELSVDPIKAAARLIEEVNR